MLAGAGANEAWTNTFLSDIDLAQAGLDPSVALEVENPLDRSQRLLRTSLLPGLLNAARFNIERQAGAFSLFELGSVFRLPGPGLFGRSYRGRHGVGAAGIGRRRGRPWTAGTRPRRGRSWPAGCVWTGRRSAH